MSNQFGDRIRKLREERELLQRQVAAALEIDTPMLSKIERGDRKARREQVAQFSKVLKADEKVLMTLWLADKLYEIIKDEDLATNALRVAESEVRYSKRTKAQ